MILFFILFALRLSTIFISAHNEKKLKRLGASEYGQNNSKLLVAAHFVFYISCVAEKSYSGNDTDSDFFQAGIALYAFSIIMLFYVIYSIRHIWTVKLIIAPKDIHNINKGIIFRLIRHPNYHLNIIPELIAVGIIFQAWYTLFIGFPLYMIPLFKRIVQEEKVMKTTFEDYK
jgi:isoprenylcysteine carboxyl methyltransferase (ICMT) family protein YpbQ